MAHPHSSSNQRSADFDPLAAETFTSAHALYAEMRESCPVAHSTAWNGFWALMRYEDVVGVLKDDKTFTTTVQNVVPKLAFTGRRPPLHLDPPEHTWYRRPLIQFFTRKKMAKIEPVIRHISAELLQPMLDAGGGDICAEFAHRLPGFVFAEFFNLSTELSMAIREVSVVYGRAVQEMDDARVKETSLQLYEIARTIIEQRKATPLDPHQDPTCALLAARDDDGNPLPDAMILGTIRQLIVVGMIAPSVFIGTMAIHLAEHQDLQDQLRANLSLVPAAIDEYLRLFTPYRGFARTAKRDVEIGGKLIKKDEPIALVYASANRDAAVFPNGDEFILNRPNIKQHVAFGLGPHQCAGAPLALLILRTVLRELLVRTRRIDLAGEITMTRWPEWGTLAVPLRITPA